MKACVPGRCNVLKRTTRFEGVSDYAGRRLLERGL